MNRALPPLALALLAGTLQAQGSAGMPEIAVRGLRVSAAPLFEGSPRQGDAVPLRVTLANEGPDAAGAVIVEGQNGEGDTTYPVELPRGARKSLTVILPPGYYGDVIRLRTNRADFAIPARRTSADARASVLAIGDGSGGFGFLQLGKSKSNQGGYQSTSQTVTVLYARPEDALTNEADYGKTACVLLIPGAERMNARAVESLRRYALRGGHVVLFGGASAPYLTDPRFGPLLPFTALTPGEASVGGRRVSVLRPTPAPGAERADVQGLPVVRRVFGVGRVSYVAGNPLEGGLALASNRTAVVEKALDLTRSAEMASRPWNLGPSIAQGEVNGQIMDPIPGQFRYGSTTTYGGGGGYGLQGTPGDPFSLPIPPTGQIALLLGVYFLVVLPANFLLLRIVKRLEWAWFTAPAIAILFAGVLFRNAGALYKTALSKQTQTVVFARSGGSEGVAYGHASIFFPNAASGPIPIPGVTLVGAQVYGRDEYGYAPVSRPLEVVRLDAPAVADYRSSSLEFRDLDYHQIYPLGEGVRVFRAVEGGKSVVRVRNGTPYTLTEARAIVGAVGSERVSGTDKPIPPGATATLDKSVPNVFGSVPSTLYRELPVLMATLKGADAGPAIGRTVPGRTYTRVLVSGEATR